MTFHARLTAPLPPSRTVLSPQACKEMLLGADLDESELAEAVLEADESGDADAASHVFLEALCNQKGQACADKAT